MKTKKGRARGLFSFLLLLPGLLPAAALADEAARSLAATCASCHGRDGRPAGADIPALAGAPKERIVGDMKAFREGARPATVMHQIARGYTAEQVERIAGYFAALRP